MITIIFTVHSKVKSKIGKKVGCMAILSLVLRYMHKQANITSHRATKMSCAEDS